MILLLSRELLFLKIMLKNKIFIYYLIYKVYFKSTYDYIKRVLYQKYQLNI